MISAKRIAVIIEGVDYERKIINSIKRNFFMKDNKALYTIIPLPMAGNIYEIWNELKTDSYLDVIELVRERTSQAKQALDDLNREAFSEVYLFFDYDSHQNNLKASENVDKVLLEMLETFDNETENGKLYISYPMAEAIRDSIVGSCCTYTKNCFYKIVGREYKKISGNDNTLSHIGSYTRNKWGDFINIYRGRMACLYNKSSLLSIKECKQISPTQIHQMQKNNETENELGIEVLSAFPKFLIDYFKEDYLENLTAQRAFNYPSCDTEEKQLGVWMKNDNKVLRRGDG